jgi:hypothetical protein
VAARKVRIHLTSHIAARGLLGGLAHKYGEESRDVSTIVHRSHDDSYFVDVCRFRMFERL